MRKVLLPRSLSELQDQMETDPEASLYAGGTDLLVKMRSGFPYPDTLICLERVQELKEVREDGGLIRIGSCATHSYLLGHPFIRMHLPVLVQALTVLGSPQIRNMGTIGGNICTASPAGDTLPPLYVLGAEVELHGRNGRRRMPIGDFIVGPGKTRIEAGEILTAVWIKKPGKAALHHFEKVGQRNALACSIASLASIIELSPDGVVKRAALAWGSVAPTILVCPGAEKALEGERLSLEKLGEAADIVRKAVRPISDVRADAEYRRIVSGNLLLRLMKASTTPGMCQTIPR